MCELRLSASTGDREVEGERITIDVAGVQVHQEALVRWRAHVQRCHQDSDRLLGFFKVRRAVRSDAFRAPCLLRPPAPPPLPSPSQLIPSPSIVCSPFLQLARTHPTYSRMRR